MRFVSENGAVSAQAAHVLKAQAVAVQQSAAMPALAVER